MEQQIGFCTTSDGVSIAYATVGSGPPLVYVCGWSGDIAKEWEQSYAREFLEAFGKSFTLVRYDMRGTGLSARSDAEISLDGLTKDLEAVIESTGADQVALLSLGLLAGPVAVTYAVAHPKHVSRIVLSSPYLRGNGIATNEQQRAMVDYVRAFGQVVTPRFSDQKDHGLDPDIVHTATEIHESAPREVRAALLRVFFDVDLSDIAGRLTQPVLVLHGSRDSIVPLALSRDFAARVKNVKFVPYTGSGAAPWADQEFILPEIFRFLGVAAQTAGEDVGHAAVHTILFTDIEDSTALTQRLGDATAQELVRAHNTIVREALRAHGGTEIKHTGDGIMASFHSASGALECAAAIQRAVEAQADAHLRVHIGLNAGEPVAEEHDLFGTSVQLARRICDAAKGGEILASDVVRQLAAGKNFLFADRGETALRGFEDPVRLYEVRWRD
jgi:class 3 adenylate cyclase/pimeloyl-ACP methyl ester carboxylesterase